MGRALDVIWTQHGIWRERVSARPCSAFPRASRILCSILTIRVKRLERTVWWATWWMTFVAIHGCGGDHLQVGRTGATLPRQSRKRQDITCVCTWHLVLRPSLWTNNGECATARQPKRYQQPRNYCSRRDIFGCASKPLTRATWQECAVMDTTSPLQHEHHDNKSCNATTKVPGNYSLLVPYVNITNLDTTTFSSFSSLEIPVWENLVSFFDLPMIPTLILTFLPLVWTSRSVH